MPHSGPIYRSIGCLSAIVYRPDLEETDDAVNRNFVGGTTPHGSSSATS